MLDDTNHDMVRSIDGISEYMSKYTFNELKKKIEMSAREREEIIKQLAEVRRKIYTIKYREFEPLVYNGESFSPAKAAEFVNRYADELSYIPGKVRLYCPLPVSIDELQLLYRSNADIALEDEIELAYEIPNPELLMSPTTHSVDIHTEAELYSTLNRIGKILSVVIRCNYEKAV